MFLDLSKAFDTVNHDILIKKIQHYGFRGKFLNVLKSYLSNRIQCTKINNRSSDFTTVKCGVPQGSILGPLLFLLYINDLPNATNMKTTLFADDSNFLTAEKCLMSLQNKVNKEICGIDLWMKSNKLSINYSKTVYMLFSNKKKAIQQLNPFDTVGTYMSHGTNASQLRKVEEIQCGVTKIYLKHIYDINFLELF